MLTEKALLAFVGGFPKPKLIAEVPWQAPEASMVTVQMKDNGWLYIDIPANANHARRFTPYNNDLTIELFEADNVYELLNALLRREGQ